MDRIKGLTKILTVISGILILAGCGGGGGDGTTQISGAGGEVRGQINTAKGAFAIGTAALSSLLTGDQVVPPVTTSASGIGTVTLNAAKRLSGVVVTTGVIGTLAHIHDSADGSILVTLEGGPTAWTLPDTADADLSAAEEAKLNAGQLYFAVHSAANPNGEIRGPINAKVRVSLLNGANEVPPVTTSATGMGVLALDPISKTIRGFVKTTGITGTVAHIHEGAAGVVGDVIVPLTETPAGSGVWTVPAGQLLTDVQIASFDLGNLYFNVHSTANAGGEIRGQILSSNITVKTASLSGLQEVPAFPTSASGTGILTLNSVTKTVAGGVKTTGMTGIAAHVHEAPVGVNGDVKVTLTETPAGSGVWLVPDNSTLTDALVSSFDAGNLYFNVHSNTVVTY